MFGTLFVQNNVDLLDAWTLGPSLGRDLISMFCFQIALSKKCNTM